MINKKAIGILLLLLFGFILMVSANAQASPPYHDYCWENAVDVAQGATTRQSERAADPEKAVDNSDVSFWSAESPLNHDANLYPLWWSVSFPEKKIVKLRVLGDIAMQNSKGCDYASGSYTSLINTLNNQQINYWPREDKCGKVTISFEQQYNEFSSNGFTFSFREGAEEHIISPVIKTFEAWTFPCTKGSATGNEKCGSAPCCSDSFDPGDGKCYTGDSSKSACAYNVLGTATADTASPNLIYLSDTTYATETNNCCGDVAIRDFSFESGASWDLTSQGNSAFQSSTDKFHSGLKSLKAVYAEAGGVAAISAPVQAAIDNDYTISGWIYREDDVSAYLDVNDIQGECTAPATKLNEWEKVECTFTYRRPVGGVQESPVPLYRYYAPSAGVHFYSTAQADSLSYMTGTNTFGLNPEGVVGNISSAKVDKTTALYRRQKWYASLYTTDQNEGQSTGWIMKETIGYIYTEQILGTKPLYRFFNNKAMDPDYFYTTDYNEGQSAGYKYEMITGYVFVPGDLPIPDLQVRAVVDGSNPGDVYFDDIQVNGQGLDDLGYITEDQKYLCNYDVSSNTWSWKDATKPDTAFNILRINNLYDAIPNGEKWFKCNASLGSLSAPVFPGLTLPSAPFPPAGDFDIDLAGSSSVGAAAASPGQATLEFVPAATIFSGFAEVIPVPVAAVCGDGILQAGEECDDSNLINDDGCSSDCENEVSPACNDGILQAGEECDSSTTKTCSDYGFSSGATSCSATLCTIDTSQCTNPSIAAGYEPLYVNPARFLCHEQENYNSILECCGPDYHFCKNTLAGPPIVPNTALARISGGPTGLIKDYYSSANFIENTVLRLGVPKDSLLNYHEYDITSAGAENEDIAISDWTDYDYLEFDVYFAGSDLLEFEIKDINDKIVLFGDVKDSLTADLGFRKWQHVKIHLSFERDKLNIKTIIFRINRTRTSNDIAGRYGTDYKITYDGRDYMAIIGIDRIFLSSIREGVTKYCGTDLTDYYPEGASRLSPSPVKKVGRWITDLDKDRDACNNVASFKWTSSLNSYDSGSTHCCGDDQNQSIPYESYADTLAGCWKGEFIGEGERANDNKIVFSEGKFYVCSSDTFGLGLNSSEVASEWKICTNKGQWYCDSDKTWKDASFYDPAAKLNLVNSKKSIFAAIADDPDYAAPPTLVEGCCPLAFCWNGTGCENSADYIDNPQKVPFFKNREDEDDYGESGYRCNSEGVWKYVSLKKDYNLKETGYCTDNSQCYAETEDSPDGKCYLHGEWDIFDGTDRMCWNGNWTTRTKYVAAALLNYTDTADITDYSLYCNAFESALGTPLTPDMGYLVKEADTVAGTAAKSFSNYIDVCAEFTDSRCVNNFCVLKFDDKTIIGTSLNKPLNKTTVPLYRIYNSDKKYHIYTADEDELEDLGFSIPPTDDETAPDHVYEGIAGYAYSTQQPGTVPLYEFSKTDDADRVYETTSSAPLGYNAGEIIAYVYSAQQPGAIPLYRLYSSADTDHLYTTDTGEKVAKANSGYKYEGIAAYVLSNPLTEAYPLQEAFGFEESEKQAADFGGGGKIALLYSSAKSGKLFYVDNKQIIFYSPDHSIPNFSPTPIGGILYKLTNPIRTIRNWLINEDDSMEAVESAADFDKLYFAHKTIIGQDKSIIGIQETKFDDSTVPGKLLTSISINYTEFTSGICIAAQNKGLNCRTDDYGGQYVYAVNEDQAYFNSIWPDLTAKLRIS